MHTPVYLPVLNLLLSRIWATGKLISGHSSDNISVHLSAWKYNQVGGIQIEHFNLPRN